MNKKNIDIIQLNTSNNKNKKIGAKVPKNNNCVPVPIARNTLAKYIYLFDFAVLD